NKGDNKKIVLKKIFEEEFYKKKNLELKYVGKVLAILYFLNKDDISLKDIRYEEDFYYLAIKSFEQSLDFTFLNGKANEIATSIIRQSVIQILLLHDLKNLKLSQKEIEDFKLGFVESYKAVLDNKKYLLGSKRVETGNLTFKIKLEQASASDLFRQLEFIDVFLLNKKLNQREIEKLQSYIHDDIKDLKIFAHDLDGFLDKAILGFYNNKTEMTWIENEELKFYPISENNISRNIEIIEVLLKATLLTENQSYVKNALNIIQAIK
ncbi:MAG: hypothetical protein ACRCX8_16325, partial [Sarcina sp.]